MCPNFGGTCHHLSSLAIQFAALFQKTADKKAKIQRLPDMRAIY
jgi:hypothetical protein